MNTTLDVYPLPETLIRRAVEMALTEDLGLQGDITTNAVIPASARTEAWIVARESGRIAGAALAEAAFRALDPGVRFRLRIADGQDAEAGSVIAEVEGATRAVLSAERTALNFLGRLSGVASRTRSFVAAVAGTGVHITDTRKTTPGLRALEKYAVRAGGGMNHRFGLFDAVLIKDNHIAAAGGVSAAIKRARRAVGHMIKIEVEVDTLDQLDEALKLPVDAVLLDNMPLAMLREAVARRQASASACVVLEVSGGVNLDTVRGIAETGVDLISVGALTHSPKCLDVALDF
jgi:nicotinate-nucleotide pyrophosphorylase (carboxylating)